MKLKQIILNHINNSKDWINKGEIYCLSQNEGYSPETGARICRQLAEDKLIQVSYYRGKRNQTLSRYARLGEQPKPKRRVELVNGVPFLIE